MEHDDTNVVGLVLNDEHVLVAHEKAKSSIKRGYQDNVYTPADDLP